MTIPGMIIAAAKSGSGKTLITCSMLQALINRNKKVRAFKCGPDYIDPMFHTKVLGVPSGNLDLYFTDEEKTKSLFAHGNDSDISVIEGVMGLYDGLGGISEEASAYHLAKTLQLPVILVVDAHGMGRSLLALIQGFLSMDQEKLIKGIILNRVSENFYHSIAPVIEKELQTEVVGFFPVQKELQLDSRYLGLKLPSEIADLQQKAQAGAEVLEKCVNMDRILEIAAEACGTGEAGSLVADIGMDSNEKTATVDSAKALKNACITNSITDQKESQPQIRIGVAYDEAFCFYYQENFRLLESLGAELVFFSPMKDASLPENIQGLLLGGGYPELVADRLSANVSMLEAIKKAVQKGMPSLAECGGFMYLHEKLRNKEGVEYPMVGVLQGECTDTGKLVRFGYAEFDCPKLHLRIRGHEFHYYDSTNCGEDCTAVKPINGRNWKCMHVGENHVWGYGHLYYPSEPAFAGWFVDACRKWKAE